jgi:two-component system NtrC family response regulator
MKNILVVDDAAANREIIREALTCSEYAFTEAENAPQGLRIMRSRAADLVIADVRMPGMSGVDLLRELRDEYPGTVVILVTAFGTVECAVEAMRAGAYDYITKPLNLDELQLVVRRALEHGDIRSKVQPLRKVLDRKHGFDNMLGGSQALLQVLDQAVRAAATDATVLIQGETGTGKELLARGIHGNSSRAARPLVTVNCGAIPRELLQSELFGHVRGSFTGALTDRRGKAEAAHGGTLFLDEIGEMPLDLQVKVLRLIQHGEIEKVGAATSTRVDIRVVAATHRDLQAMVREGTFREDLYYRLNVIPLTLPGLRHRAEDIPELVRFFFERSCCTHGRQDLRIDESLIDRMVVYHWPGNIRELENIVERIAVLTRGSEVELADLPAFLQTDQAPLEVISLDLPPKGISLGGIEKEVLLRALKKCDWNQSEAARYLQLSRKTLIYRMNKYDLAGRKPLCIAPDRPTVPKMVWAADERHESERMMERAS